MTQAKDNTPQDRRPILLLTYGGFVVRNLLLGSFARQVRTQRPLVAAVIDPEATAAAHLVAEDEVRQARVEPPGPFGLPDGTYRKPAELGGGGRLGPHLQPISFIPFPVEHWPELGTFGKATSWRTYVYYFQLGAKGTRGMELVRRLYDSGHSRSGEVAVSALQGMGRLLQQLNLLGAVEGRYLASARRWPITERWREVLREVRPAAVVSSMLTLSKKLYPSADLPAVVAAHDLGIPCGTLVQSWDNLTTKTSVLPPWLARYWTWSETMSRELAGLYPQLPKDRVEIVGSPQFDFHSRAKAQASGLWKPRADYARQVGLDPDRPWVLIGTGTPLALPAEHHLVVELVRALGRRCPSAQVLIRLHPKDDGERWHAVEAELEGSGAVIRSTAPQVHQDLGGLVTPAAFYGDQLNSLLHAAVVVCSSSTLTVDAALLDRPVVCSAYDTLPAGSPPDELFPEGRALAFSRGSHYAPLVETGGVRVVYDLESCISTVERYLAEPDLDSESRRRLAERVTRMPIGDAGLTLARRALALADASPAV